MNKVFLIGNLTRDPELNTTPSGVAVCKFGIAVNRNFSSADGTRETDFFNITVWRNQAENCGKYLNKGNKVAVVGSLQTHTYEVDGQKKTGIDIVADNVEFLTPKGGSDGYSPISRGDTGESVSATKKRPALQPMDDDGLPF